MDFKKEIMKPIEDGTVISADQFGMLPTNPDNFEALSKALHHCREHKISKLVIPRGKYYFATEQPIIMKDMKDFILEGSNAEFVYCITGQFFKIDHCSKVWIRNLFLDWDWDKHRLASVIKVVQVSREEGYIDFEYLQEGELDLAQNWVTTNALDPATWTPGCEDGVEYGVYKNNAETFDKKVRLTPKLYRCHKDLSNLSPLHFPVGSIHLVRHYLYNGGIFVIQDTSHITMERITIYSAPGFGYHIGGHTHHLFMDRCDIILRPGTDRRITTTADAVHVKQTNGYLLFEKCDFGFHGDDCINIHDNIVMYVEKESTQSLSYVSSWFPVDSGDPIEIRNADFSPMGLTLTVKNISLDKETGRTILTFEECLPDHLPSNSILFNHAYNSGYYHIKDCFFHETRARGILLQASNGLVENCRFYRTQGAAIQIETGASKAWSEGMGVDQLTIRNNVFERCDVNDWDKGVIYMSTYLPEGVAKKPHGTANPTILPIPWEANYRTAYPVFTNICITDNTFREYPRRAMAFSSFENLEVSNNRFSNEISRKINYAERGSIWAELGRNAEFFDNNYERSPYMAKEFLEFDPETTENIVVRNNV